MDVANKEETSVDIRLRTDAMPPPEERRRLRIAAGLTGIELAAAISVSPASIYNWETDKRSPTGLQRAAYLRALDEIGEQLDARGRRGDAEAAADNHRSI
jgi:transcriptional regulator with XRE-family HTH domain